MDMSFPVRFNPYAFLFLFLLTFQQAATLILGNFVPKEHQGIAASLVATVVNYSISIGLGIAGTVESHVNNEGQDLLKGYRGALYAGIGLSGTAVLLSLLFVVSEWRQMNKASTTRVSKRVSKRT